MRRKTTATLLGLFTTLALATSCNKNSGLENAFSVSWRAEGDQSTRLEEGRAVLDRLAKLEALPRVPAAVGVTGRGLRGRALPGGVVWHYVGPVDVLPSLVGDRVGFSGDGMVTVLDVKSGERSFHIPVAGRRLEGLAYDGELYAMLLVDSDDARPDELRIVDHDGRTKFMASTTARLGTPHALGGLVLIPWQRQYVSAFDMQTGATIGRLLVRDSVHQLDANPSGIWAFGAGASHIDAALLDTRGEQALRLPKAELPGDPPWPIDGSKPRPPRSRPIALWAVPSFSGQARFEGGVFGYGYYEVVIGLSVQSKQVKWSNFFPRSMVGSAESEAGITTCLEDGTIWQVRWSDGQTKRIDTLDTRLKGCAVSPVTSALVGRRSGDLAIQVRKTISSTGATMAKVHEFLVGDLARSETARATYALLAIAQDPTTSSALAERAADYLGKRRTGASAMIRALRENVPAAPDGTKPAEDPTPSSEEDESGTEDLDLDLPTARKRPPPVAALAHALTQMNQRSAANALAAQLTLPSIDGADSRAVVQALTVLGGKKQLQAVRSFFVNFKNGGGDQALLDALVLAAKFLLEHGTEDERSLLRVAKTDVLTHPDLAKALEQLALDDPPTTTAPAPSTSEPAKKPTNSPPAKGKPASPVP
jgi:hypothetical protein